MAAPNGSDSVRGDTFVLDANIFIEAHRRYYGLDLCPGFWESLRHFARRGRLLSIDRVYRELEDGGAEAFNLPVKDTFEMLRELQVRFGWER